MIPPSFDGLYRRLAEAAQRYNSVERSPDRLPALADAHWELHLARRAVAAERRRLEDTGAIYTSRDRRWLNGLGIDARGCSLPPTLSGVTNGSGSRPTGYIR